MRVALDLEGVLADTHLAFLRRYNDRFGTSLERSDIEHWNFGSVREDFNERKDLEKGRVNPFLRGYKGWPGFHKVSEDIWRESFEKIPSIFEEVPGIFKRKNVEVDIVTGRKRVDSSLRNWLKKNGIERGVHYDSLIIEKKKHSLGYDLFVDDKPHLHRNLVGNKGQGIVFDQPWNRDANCGESLRAKSHPELEEVIRDVG